jgi:putative transposase
VVIQFIDDHRDRFGVEPICRVLTEHQVKIAPSGYYAFKKQPASARAVSDAELVTQIERVFWDRNLGRGISGARKIWRLLRREGIVVARCTVERLMRQQGLRGIRRGKQFITTRPDGTAVRPPDHVERRFRADRPNELWVVDFTYVPTWSGMAFTAFVTDVFARRIVGWRTMNRMPTQLPLDALEMALWVRDTAGEDVTGVIQHSDAGAQYTAIRYAERLADVGAIASIGTVGDSYERPGRVNHRSLQNGMRQDRRPIPHHGRTGTCHPVVGALVQREPPALLDRISHTDREGKPVLP